MRHLLAAFTFFISTDAMACERAYTTDDLLTDLMSIEDFLRSGDNDAAKVAADQLELGLPCVDEVLPAMVVGRVYRAMGGGKFVGGDQRGGALWFVTAAEYEQNYEYGLSDLPADHELRRVNVRARARAGGDRILVPDLAFVEGEHFLDGRLLTRPKARLERPHLYQHQSGAALSNWVIDGNSFPPGNLETPRVAATVAAAPLKNERKPKRGRRGTTVAVVATSSTAPLPVIAPPVPVVAAPVDPEIDAVLAVNPAVVPDETFDITDEPEVVVVNPEPLDLSMIQFGNSADAATSEDIDEEFVGERVRVSADPVIPLTPAPEPSVVQVNDIKTLKRKFPIEKVPLIAGGAVALIGSVVTYGLSGKARKGFDTGATQQDLDQFQKQTNQLVLISGGLFAVGGAGLTWGVMIDGGPGYAVRVRF
jgi:hypothetical protein